MMYCPNGDLSVFSHEPNTFHCWRRNGKSHTNKPVSPPKSPLSLGVCESHLIHKCLDRRHTYHRKRQLDRFRHLYTSTQQSPHWLNGTPHISPQNCPFASGNRQSQLSASSLDPADPPTQTASRSSQPFCHNTLDIPTH